MQKSAVKTTKTFPLHSVALDRSLETPLHRQIFNQIRRMIAERTLAAGSVLPSSRSLSEDLRVARNVVITAYEQLSAEGYVQNRPGTPPRVTELSGNADTATKPEPERAVGHAVSEQDLAACARDRRSVCSHARQSRIGTRLAPRPSPACPRRRSAPRWPSLPSSLP